MDLRLVINGLNVRNSIKQSQKGNVNWIWKFPAVAAIKEGAMLI